jgi:hypothetical protein
MRIRKATAILLAAAMIISFAACGLFKEEVTISSSRTKAAFEELDFDNIAYYSTEAEIGEKIVIYIQGDKKFISIEGSHSFGDMKMLLVDGETHLINDEYETIFHKPSDGQIDGMLEDLLGEMRLDFDNTVLYKYGNAEFMGESRYYEEVIKSNGGILRHYFDGDSNTIIGRSGDGLVFEVSMSAEIPEGAFDVPQGYDMIDIQEE